MNRKSSTCLIPGRLKIFLLVSLCLFTFRSFGNISTPAVIITNLPTFGSFGPLGGNVTGVALGQFAVAVFIYIPGQGWWSKPTCPGQPLTPIHPDGSWSANITTGGVDQQATRVAVLLVNTNYNQPCVLGDPVLSTNIYAQAVASAIVTRPSPGVWFISFSGYDWWVKSGANLGPGPNNFSDSSNNVWVDTDGSLHLCINTVSNQWQCAEIVSARTFGYGSYRFELGSSVDSLDPNIVLGLFTWSDDPAFAYREMDVEGSRWSNPADTNNIQFVLQPPTNSAHILRYRTPPGVVDSTHLFTWQTNRITWEAVAGSYSTTLVSNVIRTFAFTDSSAIPRTGDENVRLNFWLNKGQAPMNGQSAEFIIKNFRFVPLGQPAPPTFGNVKCANGQFQFAINVQKDWWYQVQSSSDLHNWQSVANVLATNSTFNFAASLSSGSVYFRVLTLP